MRHGSSGRLNSNDSHQMTTDSAGGVIHFGRAATVAVGIILSVTALVLCSSAVYRSDWLIVHLHSTKQDHWHGLWRDCYQKRGEEMDCQLKLQRDEDRCKIQLDKYENKEAHASYAPLKIDERSPREDSYIHECYHDWQKGVLGLLLAAEVCGLFALFFLVFSLCSKTSAHISCVLHLASFGCSAAACVWFYVVSHLKEFQWVNDYGDSQPAPQTRGAAFNFAVASILMYLLAFAFNLFAAALACIETSQSTAFSASSSSNKRINNGSAFRPKTLHIGGSNSSEFNKNNGTFATEPTTTVVSPRSATALPLHTVSASVDV